MRTGQKIVLISILTGFTMTETGLPYPRIYGNYQFNFQRQHQPVVSNNLYNHTLYFNLLDHFMLKNRFLFTAYVTRNEYVSNSKRIDFRPRLDFELSGQPYRLFFSYLPYNLPQIGGSRVYYRQYQGMAGIHPAGLPNLRFNWNRNDLHDNLLVRKSDQSSRTWSVGSSWSKTFFNTSLVYTRQENVDRILKEKTLLNQSFTSGGGVNLNVPGSGYFSSNYNYSYNQREDGGVITSKTNTHSLTSFYSTPIGKRISFNTNYSGRYSTVERFGDQIFQDQTLNNSVSYRPLSRMELSLLRADQKSLSPSSKTSQDFWAGNFSYFFPFWRKIESRLSYSKTYFVQSSQGQYSSDVYYLSLSGQAYPGLHVRADLSVNRRSGDLFASSRYQTSRFLDIRTQPWEKLQLNYYYQSNLVSQKLVLTQVSTENHNLYLSYYPVPGWSTTLNYLERFSGVGIVPKQKVFSAQIYHTFRNQYSLNFNYSLTRAAQAVSNQSDESNLLSTQLVVFLERNTTLTLSYSASNLNLDNFSSTLGATLYQQF